MSWMAPWTGVLAAAVFVPLLVLLYFLKLRRRPVRVTSTLLWKKAIQDLQVNAPFQRLRRNLLLLLQLLAMLAALVALARPVMLLQSGEGRRYVLLIDRSASMNAVEDGRSRLEAAQQEALRVVDGLRDRAGFSFDDKADQAMVIAFDARAKVLCNFTSNRAQLRAAIESIEPTDGPSSLGEAVTVARAFAESAGEEVNNRSAAAQAQLELFSDGRVRDLETIVVGEGEMNYHRIGAGGDNLGIVAMEARRNYEDAGEVNVFATVANWTDAPATCDVQMSIDGGVRAVRAVTVPPRRVAVPGGAMEAGTASVSFVLRHGVGGVVSVRHLRPDMLASDDAAWAVLSPPRALKVLFVTPGSTTLEDALRACPISELEVCTPEQFDAMDATALAVDRRFDLIVLDRYEGTRPLPRGHYLCFGRPPAQAGVGDLSPLENQFIVDWQERHPVMQFVNLANVFAERCVRMDLPPDALLLAEFGASPAIAMVQRSGSVLLLVNFDPMGSNWPLEPSFVIFCYNAVNYLGVELARGEDTNLAVHDPIVVQGDPDAEGEGRLDGPGLFDVPLARDPSGGFRFPGTARAGVYTLRAPDRPAMPFAVNLLDAAEGDIQPAERIQLAGLEVVAQEGATGRANREIWPYLALFALLMLMVEWTVYNGKLRL